MALFKKKLPDLPSPPSKFSEIPTPDFDEDFPRYTPTMDVTGMEDKPKISPMPISQFPREEQPMEDIRRKPLFIKIDRYEDAISTLNSIREKLEEASKIISELRQIRHDEDAQLDEWSENIREIKEKLMNVDSMMFE